MTDIHNFKSVIEIFKSELLEAIKERIQEIGKDSVIRIYPLSVTESSIHSRGIRNTLEIRNIYLDESDTLCGDFGCINDGVECGAVFGKSINSLFIEDLYAILWGLFGKGWTADKTENTAARDGFHGKESSTGLRKEVWKRRLLKKGA